MLIGLAYAGFRLFKVLKVLRFLISRIAIFSKGGCLNAKHGGGNHYISIFTLWSDYCNDINYPKRTGKKINTRFNIFIMQFDLKV
jgi:hypothetical protein